MRLDPCDLDPIATVIDGRSCWLFDDGTVLPVIRGGAEGDGGEDDAAKKAAADKAAADAAAKAEADAKAATDAKADEPKLSMTQAQLDALLEKNTGRVKAKTESELKKYLEQQAMGETDRLKAESADKDKVVADAKAEVLATKIETAAERLAIAAGVKADRVPKFMRLVDLSDIDALSADGKPDADAIKKLVEAELADAPEFKGTAAAGGASGAGDMNGNGDAKVWTREEIAKLSVDDFEKNEVEIMKQLQGAGVN